MNEWRTSINCGGIEGYLYGKGGGKKRNRSLKMCWHKDKNRNFNCTAHKMEGRTENSSPLVILHIVNTRNYRAKEETR
jgi:hypothetical protein